MLLTFFVNDAFFSTAHRAHASTEGVTKYFLKAAVCWLPHAEGNKMSSLLMIF